MRFESKCNQSVTYITCGTNLRVAKIYVWHKFTCGTKLRVAQNYVWHTFTCDTNLRVAFTVSYNVVISSATLVQGACSQFYCKENRVSVAYYCVSCVLRRLNMYPDNRDVPVE